MRRVLLVSPYFLPSNVAGIHRVRLMSSHLESYGWDPTVLTVDSSYYEEKADPLLLKLIPRSLAVERVAAWPASVCRRVGIGDISLRGQLALRRRLHELVCKARPAVVFATVLPGYTAMVGAWAKRRFNVPFVLDYQDPWVSTSSGLRGSDKAGIANKIARWVEPRVVQEADAITAVSDGTLDSLRLRNLLPAGIPIEVIPIGADASDQVIAAEHGRSLIERKGETFHVAYLGTLTSRMLPALDAVFAALASARAASSRTIVLHLIGTSALPGGEDQFDLKSRAAGFGVADAIDTHPGRVSYLDALRTMQDADLLLLVGSTDSHYTASKLFPYWLSRKPILGVFHRSSTIVGLAKDLGGVGLVLYDKEHGPQTTTAEAADLLARAAKRMRIAPGRNENAFQEYSAEGVSSRYAELFDRITAKCA